MLINKKVSIIDLDLEYITSLLGVFIIEDPNKRASLIIKLI